MDLIAFRSAKRQLGLALIRHGRIILSTLAPNLVALAECGERVADRHLARLVALQAHPFQDIAARQSVALPDQLEQPFPSAAAARLPLTAGWFLSCVLARLRRFVSLDGS